MWVKAEYAGEVAVLSTWLCGLLPWSVSLLQVQNVTAIWFRFHPGRFLYVFGVVERGGSPWNWVWEVPGFVASRGEALASYAWIGGVAVFLVALALSVAYYLDEERVEAGRVDPVRALGGLLVASGVALLAASGLLFQHQAGTTVPVGTVIQLGLGAVLLRVERT